MSKKESVLELFFNEPTKHWHFEEIVRIAQISRPQATHWLKLFVREVIIRRIKERGRMPYYIGNYSHPNYQIKKRLFALKKMDTSGFLKHLISLPKAKTVIIFGSLSRWDWHKESDIDVFIFGTDEGLAQGRYEQKLNREIQVFTAKTKAELKKFRHGLLQNILEGYRVKGALDFLEVKTHA